VKQQLISNYEKHTHVVCARYIILSIFINQ